MARSCCWSCCDRCRYEATLYGGGRRTGHLLLLLACFFLLPLPLSAAGTHQSLATDRRDWPSAAISKSSKLHANGRYHGSRAACSFLLSRFSWRVCSGVKPTVVQTEKGELLRVPGGGLYCPPFGQPGVRDSDIWQRMQLRKESRRERCEPGVLWSSGSREACLGVLFDS